MVLTLPEWRRLRGLTKKEMANICGVHQNTYRRWEASPRTVSLISAYKIAAAIGVPLEDIKFEPENKHKM